MSMSLGFDRSFLEEPLSLPKIKPSLLAPVKSGNGREIKYTHFSIFVHKERRLPMMSAVNIKGEDFVKVIRDGPEAWDYSDQIKEEFQLDNRFYGQDLNTFDRGHLVRRIDPCWGDLETSARAEVETFRWVNCTPQHKKLNQKGGVWFQLEQHIMEKGVKNKIANVSVFAGPVLSSRDPIFIRRYKNSDVQIPLLFWKVIVWRKSNKKLYAVGFLMNQAEWIKKEVLKPVPEVSAAVKKRLHDDYFENLVFNDNKTYQVRIDDIEMLTGIRFGWTNVNFPYKSKKPTAVKATKLKKVQDFSTLVKAKVKVDASLRRAKVSIEKAMTSATVKRNVQNGFSGLLKRYDIKNIKL